MCINLDLNIKEGPMDKNDHDLLIEIHTDMKWVKCKFQEHLKKHWWFVTTVVGIVLAMKFLA